MGFNSFKVNVHINALLVVPTDEVLVGEPTLQFDLKLDINFPSLNRKMVASLIVCPSTARAHFTRPIRVFLALVQLVLVIVPIIIISPFVVLKMSGSF